MKGVVKEGKEWKSGGRDGESEGRMGI